MAHFAELDDDDVVIRVIVIGNDNIKDEGGQESEAVGVQFCKTLFGGGRWKQTFYSGSIRKNFAGAGYTYDRGRNAFIPPMPGPEWTLDEETCRWVEPETDG